ncbi:hypothetical protein BCR33DRAFT_658199 [Rhizoclosmatium globosum]|uniref:FERM domain-containing protein n=1 Tax=Rhizoclosmatium globosum TaxID=329046 RepID=A0A1Y2CJV4_9FUNG|nr:hypothetical protein BCR33DRAFT_658199 [Rhizoclosmatium globosum]|eukprot:ORY47292.1 hypothetical protein BCR33DRAFT_658199 [Rhizoclosmatium globosum]
MHPNEWAPPVVLYEDPFTNQVACVSVRVRLLLGDTFLDVHQRLKPEDVTCETVCTRIIERQNISAEASKLFALWIVGKDLEIQIRPKTNLVDIVKDWRQLVVKYTHFPQAVDPDHMFNRYWLLFRREASVCKKVERELTLKDTIALKMLFGEAKRNIITGRYPCSVKDAINLAALQLQVSIGNYDPIRCPSGYVAKNPDLIKNILSAKIVKKKTVWSWEKHIRNEHERLKDISTKRAQVWCVINFLNLYLS